MTLVVRTLLLAALILGVGVAEKISFSHLSADRLRVRVRNAPAERRVSIQEVWTRKANLSSGTNHLGAVSHSAIKQIGRGMGIIFSPDLSEPGNREFFCALGFAYFEDPDWHVVLKEIREFNATHPTAPIETLLIQSHGTNGDALKLQNGKDPEAPRSYVAPAALQENLERTGVRVCLLAACNAGRLFRPENYLTVRADEGNHLFEPPTLGIINASEQFDPERSSVTIVRRVESRLEVINECHVSELSPDARAEIIRNSDGRLKPGTKIAVPEMLIQLLLKDQELRLIAWGKEMEKSRAETNDKYRERLISQFLRFVNSAATREQQPSTRAPQAD